MVSNLCNLTLDICLKKHYIYSMNKKMDTVLKENMEDGNRIIVSRHAVIKREGNFRSIIFSGMPVFHYHEEDIEAKKIAIVLLVDTGLAGTKEVAVAFEVHRSTIFRLQQKIAEEGILGIMEQKRGPKGGKKIKGDLEKVLKKLKSEGLSNVAIAHKLGLSKTGVWKALVRIGYRPKEKKSHQNVLWEADAASRSSQDEKEESTFSKHSEAEAGEGVAGDEKKECIEERKDTKAEAKEEGSRGIEGSADADPTDRVVDRMLARMGLLDDAAPVFCRQAKVSFAGFLLAVPFLVSSGVFEIAQKVYGSIGPAFYGLRTTLLTLLMMAIVRIKRAEGLKEKSPLRLGLLLGLDRTPEVKTLRRKLTCLAGFGKAYELLKQLVRHRLRERRKIVGYLYVDGFVRAYHGKRRLSKAYVAQRRLAMAGVTDYWVNDQNGEPLFVVTSSANEALTKMLKPVLAEIREVVGKRRLTVVFDRGGWSPKLFQEIVDGGFDIMTYRKGKQRKISKGRFIKHSLQVNGNKVSYQLHDQAVRFLKGKLRLRQVTRLREGNYQTQIVTSRWDLSAAMVVFRMFNRWRQENYFKYMREEYALDVLVDYNFDAVDLVATVANPERRELAKRLKTVRTELAKCERKYGAELCNNKGTSSKTIRGFKIAHGALGRQVRKLSKQMEKLKKKRRSLPDRISAHKAYKGELVRLSYERKLLTDVIKMIAYQTESALVNLIKPYYARTQEEGRNLMVSLFDNTGMLECTDDKIVVTFDVLSSPHRTSVLGNLCKELNKIGVKFPGTEYVVEYRVHDKNVA